MIPILMAKQTKRKAKPLREDRYDLSWRGRPRKNKRNGQLNFTLPKRRARKVWTETFPEEFIITLRPI